MKIQYYGTSAGGGIPEIFCSCRVCEHARKNRDRDVRTRSQAVIDGKLSIEYPVDTFLHTLHGNLDMRKIHHVLVTHSHHDHFLIADVLSRPLGVTEPVRFYGSEETVRGLKRAVDAREEAFRTGKRIRTCDFTVEVHELKLYTPTDILDYRVIPLRAHHAGDTGAMIYAIQSGEKSILWAHDTGPLYPEVIDYLKDSGLVFDFVSLDCTLKRGQPITSAHMDANQCIEMAEILRKNGNATDRTRFMLSHIGHLVEQTHEEMEKEMAPYGMEVAYDGMTVTI